MSTDSTAKTIFVENSKKAKKGVDKGGTAWYSIKVASEGRVEDAGSTVDIKRSSKKLKKVLDKL